MTSREQFTKRCSPSLNIQKEKKTRERGELCKYATQWMHAVLEVLLDWIQKAFLKSEGLYARYESPRRLAWPPPGFISVPWKSRFRLWAYTERCWFQRSHSWNVVWKCLGACQCSSLATLVTPQTIKSMFYSTRPLCDGFFVLFWIFGKKHKVWQRVKGFFLLQSELRNMARQPHSVITAL